MICQLLISQAINLIPQASSKILTLQFLSALKQIRPLNLQRLILTLIFLYKHFRQSQMFYHQLILLVIQIQSYIHPPSIPPPQFPPPTTTQPSTSYSPQQNFTPSAHLAPASTNLFIIKQLFLLNFFNSFLLFCFRLTRLSLHKLNLIPLYPFFAKLFLHPLTIPNPHFQSHKFLHQSLLLPFVTVTPLLTIVMHHFLLVFTTTLNFPYPPLPLIHFHLVLHTHSLNLLLKPCTCISNDSF